MSERPCRLRTLAREPGCRIDACEHGHVHLSLGAVTLRLRPDELDRLHRAVATAVAGLASEAPAPPTRAGALH